MKTSEHITKQFNHGFTWNLWGSVTFEVFKTMHNVLLLNLVAPRVYGLIGTLFSIIYLAVRLADFGTSNTLSPFFYLLSQSKEKFKSIFLKGFLLPQAPVLIAAPVVTAWFYWSKVSPASTTAMMLIVPALVFLETVRLVLRQFLHLAFQSKIIVIAESSLFFGYLAAVWTPILVFKMQPTVGLIFFPYVLDSLAALAVFGVMLSKFYNALPQASLSATPGRPPKQAAFEKQAPSRLWRRITTTRLLNYILRLGRNMFTSNLLTPLFALQFGLKQAGIFYFASVLATSIQAIVKAILGYSGGALMAHVKTGDSKHKRAAFHLLGNKLVMVLIPITIFLAFNYKQLISWCAAQDTTNAIITLSLLYLAITFTEFFFSLYEQFYVMEEAVLPLVLFRGLEFVLFYAVFSWYRNTSPATILLGIFAARTLCFSLMVATAYRRWRIKPSFKVSAPYVAGCMGFSLVCMLLFAMK